MVSSHKRTALLVIDMIRGFLHKKVNGKKCALYVPGAMSIIPEIIKEVCKLEQGDYVYFMKDCHDKNDKEFKHWPKHCVIGSHERDLTSAFGNVTSYLGKAHCVVLNKSRFSAFYNTELDSCLFLRDVERIIITGVCTEVCVFATALDAAYRDYDVIIPRKCVHPFNKKLGEQKLEYLQKFLGVKVK